MLNVANAVGKQTFSMIQYECGCCGHESVKCSVWSILDHPSKLLPNSTGYVNKRLVICALSFDRKKVQSVHIAWVHQEWHLHSNNPLFCKILSSSYCEQLHT